MRDNELTRFIDSMAWLLDDEPKIRRYFEVNGKEIVNDFKEKDEPKPKKERTIASEPLRKRAIDGLTTDDFWGAYKKACKVINNDPTTITILPSTHTIKRVIINAPAVIILWGDDTKTIAKCEDMDTFDAEKGFAIALAKKFVGNERFRNMLEKYVWEVE